MNYKWILVSVFTFVAIAFGYYAISPLFRNIKVDEALPSTLNAQPVQSDRQPVVDGIVTGTTGHPASGNARIVYADGTPYLRYENFKTINGPDIFVYLSKDLEAKEFISLGKVKATEGNINYKIPANVNLEEYKYVLTWCKAFGVLFNNAQIN